MEKKSIEISQVAASEKESAQTESVMATWQRCGVLWSCDPKFEA